MTAEREEAMFQIPSKLDGEAAIREGQKDIVIHCKDRLCLDIAATQNKIMYKNY